MNKGILVILLINFLTVTQSVAGCRMSDICLNPSKINPKTGGPRSCSVLSKTLDCMQRVCGDVDTTSREDLYQFIRERFGLDCHNLAVNIPTTPLCYFCTVLLTALYFCWLR